MGQMKRKTFNVQNVVWLALEHVKLSQREQTQLLKFQIMKFIPLLICEDKFNTGAV